MIHLSRIVRAFAPALSLATLALAALAPAAVHAAPKPLFAEDSTLQLRIEAPFNALLRSAPRSTEGYDAKLIVKAPAAETLAIKLSPRGISRRTTEACEFPPLRIEFKEKPGAGSLFKGQKELKLATHCRNDNDYQDYGLLEFTAYRLNNVLTPQSFRVRLAEIDYVEAGSSSVRVHRRGFLIEDVDDLASRNDLKQIKTTNIEHNQLDPVATARSDLFQYLIGNQDWSDTAGAAGTHCCHNVNLLGKTATDQNGLVPVARDFDSSGWVNAPYALPPKNVPIHNVRTRFYRGFCQFNDQAKAAAQDMLAKRTALMDVVSGAAALTSRSRNSATRYLQEFFDEISDPAKLQERIIGRCRG
jgi:hypothetical protein